MLLYLLILFAKIIEVTLMTLRIVFITKGERKLGAMVAFVEVTLWLFIVTFVLNDLMSDPIKAVFYALGFAIGNYMGSLLENKIGLGLSQVQIIVKEEHGKPLANDLREAGFAVTLVLGEGKNHDRYILFMYVQRKRVRQLLELVKHLQDNAVITVMETKPLYGGYGLRK
ncbi:MAG: DUF2179 domain-containing protein [Clostridia bacterium]|nr:DUF2179 domain-containing protein [Clostridia bacterium]